MTSFSSNFSKQSKYVLTLNVDEVETSTENNTSTINWSLTGYKPSGTGYHDDSTNANNHIVVTINGETVADTYIKYDFTGQTPKTIVFASGSKTISHDDEGKKTISVSGSFTHSSYFTGIGNASVSGTVKLADIARASEPSVSVSSATLGETTVTINTNRKSAYFTHVLKYNVAGTSGVIDDYVAQSQIWSPPLSLANYLPNSTSAICVITCDTYNGSQFVGSKSVNLTLNVPTSIKPTISNLSLTEADTTMISKNLGCFVQSKSKLKGVVTASGSYGSTISSYEITGIDNSIFKSKEFTTDVLSQSGVKTVSVKVIDSRGRASDTKTYTYTCVEYSPPKIEAQVQRCLSNGTLNDDGTYMKYTFKASISPINNKNTTHTYKILYKTSSASSYTTKTISTSGYTLDSSSVLSGATFSNTTTYNVIFRVTDIFGSVDLEKTLGTAADLMNFNSSGKSMAIGKVSDASASEKKLQIAMDKTEITGTTSITGATTISGSLTLNNKEVLVFEKVTSWT